MITLLILLVIGLVALTLLCEALLYIEEQQF